MKKILFSAAALALLATAGCTRNEDNGVKGDVQEIAFTGEFAAAGELDRVEFLPSTNAINHPINWNPGDKIGICYTTEPAFMGFNNPYVATTTTAAATTKFEADPEGAPIQIDKSTTNTFYAYCPYNMDIYAAEHSVSNFPSPLRQHQTGDPATYTYPSATFLVASKEYAGEDVVSFQFSNVFPVLMVGLEGDAKIDRVMIQAPEGCNIFMEGTLDLTKIPAKGANYDEFTNGFFTVDAGTEMPGLEIAFDTPLTLVDGEHTYFPVMVAPFDYAAGDVFTFIIIGKNKAGGDVAVTRTITTQKAGTLGAGQSIDIDFNARLAKEDFGQGEGEIPGPDDPGKVVFEDDFSYICSIFDNPENDLDKYGWTENRSKAKWATNSSDPRNIIYETKNFVGPIYNNYTTNQEGKTIDDLLKAKGWGNTKGSTYGYYNHNGMLRLGQGMPNDWFKRITTADGNIVLPLTGLVGDEPTDLTLALKAARHTDRYGMPEAAESKLIITVAGEGTQINGDAKVELAPQDPFTWYEYTIPVTGATAASTLTFALGDKAQMCVYIDDVKLTTSNGETANTEGTAVEKEPNDILYHNAPNYEIVINAEADQTDDNGNFIATENERLEFVCSGAWWIMSEYPDDDGWCQLSPVNWCDSFDDRTDRLVDNYGNGIRNIIGVAAAKTNTTGAERSCELQIFDPDTYDVLATFTIIQPAAEVAPVDYGTQVLSVNWEEGDAVETPHMTGTAAAASSIYFTEEAKANFTVNDYMGVAGNTGLGFVNVCPKALDHINMEAGQPYQFEVNIPLSQFPEDATKIVVTCDGYKPNPYKAGGNCYMGVLHNAEFIKAIINNDTPDSETNWFTVANEFEISNWADRESDEIRIFIYTYVGPNDNGLANALIDNINVYYK